MTAQLTLSDQLYARLRQLAEKQKRTVNDVAEELLEQSVSNNGVTRNGTVAPVIEDWTEPDPAVDRERGAYIAMHPKLKKNHLGKHVAIYGGELIDMDDDFAALYDRIDDGYPDEFVWITTVQEEPIQTLHVRSPQFLK